MDVKSSDVCAKIRVAVLGDWVPLQLAKVLALQREEDPETVIALIGWTTTEPVPEELAEQFDFVLSTIACRWPDWECEPLWHDRLSVAVAKRSHLLVYPEVPCQEVLKQPLISVQSTAEEPWRAVVRHLFDDALQTHDQTVSTFEIAMTLVSAGYGITIAPATRLVGHLHRGIIVRPLLGAPPVVMAYLSHPCTVLTEQHARFACRARSVP